MRYNFLMGYMVELNTLLGLPKDFDTDKLEIGKIFTVIKERERSFPLHLAVLMVDPEWNFYGYAVVRSAVLRNGKTELLFEVLTLLSKDEQQIYKRNFLTAAHKSGELK